MGRTILLGLNEINFDYVRYYIDQGRLPGFRELLDRFGLHETQAEQRYEELEPWIQWVTVHTGLAYREHGVFRLGDIVGRPVPQIFEELEARGFSVGAVSPMNAENRLHAAPYFVPDPWTATEVSGSAFLRRLGPALAEAVNANAHGRMSPRTVATLAAGLVRFARPVHYPLYARLVARGLRRHWPRAMLLDLLLFDAHAALYGRHRPDLSVLFLNAGAHIQHHYFFNSPACDAKRRNPPWYVDPQADPVLEVLELYDRMLRELRARFPDARLIVATGLRQVPYPEVTFYYRLVDHLATLRELGVADMTAVEPRMSRDFLVRFKSEAAAIRGREVLEKVCDTSGERLFEELERRGAELFVTLTYPHEIHAATRVHAGAREIANFRRHVALVAIKNGHHDRTGYVIDTRTPVDGDTSAVMPLRDLHTRVKQAVAGSAGDS